MGLSIQTLYGVMYARKHGADLSNMLTIGRQYCLVPQDALNTAFQKFDPSFNEEKARALADAVKRTKLPSSPFTYSEPIFSLLGAGTIDSLDYSDYEGATILHDMNLPLSETENLRERFTFILDGGALEHVFNYSVAVRNCMEMVKIGDVLLLVTPTNNWFGHGFYQFSPELFYSLLRPVNGFDDTIIFMPGDDGNFYEVASPLELKRRVDICSSSRKEIEMTVISRKITRVPETLAVQQSDYLEVWADRPLSGGGQNPVALRKVFYRLREDYLNPQGIASSESKSALGRHKITPEALLMGEPTSPFPVDRIPFGSSIVLYGAGGVGHDWHSSLELVPYCRVALWVDKRAGEIGSPVEDVSKIMDTEYDYVVIAVSDPAVAREIADDLVSNYGVAPERMVYAKESYNK